MSLDLRRNTLGAVIIVAMLAACGGSSTSLTPWPAMPAVKPARVNPAYGLIYSFGGYPDGAAPYSGLTDVNGSLYGTASAGGTSGNGMAFGISISSRKEIAHDSFSGSNGAAPEAGLIGVGGKLYGTAAAGGTSSKGTVFAISAGKPTALYNFKGGTDGAVPTADLNNHPANDTLYGTTKSGGTNNKGTVFALSPSGKETVLHSFGGSPDGALPLAALTGCKQCSNHDTLYGTTSNGGKYKKGTVFSISLSGTERVVYSFKGGSDGAIPQAGLFDANGTLYGTTEIGGANNAGTIFAISSSGVESVIYSFKGHPDGQYPFGGILDVNGTLYGTTASGGEHGKGTVFKLEPSSGVETLLHSFGKSGSTDGAGPRGRLIEVNGTLYGTTLSGGAGTSACAAGCGTVFWVSP